jgi:putative cytochrome c oxidase, subunit II
MNNGKNEHKEQRIGLWLVGGAAGLSVLTILFLSVWGWETGKIEGSPTYGQAAASEVAASAVSQAAASESNEPAVITDLETGETGTAGGSLFIIQEAPPLEVELASESVGDKGLPVPVDESVVQNPGSANEAQDEARIVTANGAVKFYFATGKADVAPGAQEALKDVLVAALGGKKVVVSGYHDSTGNAQANEELSKQRAFAVRTVLLGFGVPDKQIELRKPSDTEAGSGAEARRVEVFVE